MSNFSPRIFLLNNITLMLITIILVFNCFLCMQFNSSLRRYEHRISTDELFKSFLKSAAPSDNTVWSRILGLSCEPPQCYPIMSLGSQNTRQPPGKCCHMTDHVLRLTCSPVDDNDVIHRRITWLYMPSVQVVEAASNLSPRRAHTLWTRDTS